MFHCTVVLAVWWYCGGRPNCELWPRLVTLQWSELWHVNSLQSPCWEIGNKSRSWNNRTFHVFAIISSSSGGAPSGEHSRLHNWTPFGTILCAKPRRVRPRLVGCRSDSMVRSQVRRGRPLRRRQSVGRRLMAAWRAREWSCDESARAICPNRRNRLATMVEVTGGCPVLRLTSSFVTWAV